MNSRLHEAKRLPFKFGLGESVNFSKHAFITYRAILYTDACSESYYDCRCQGDFDVLTTLVC
ncbi:hypothetical protein ACU8KH_01931 [Lachancea thermotolerans]